MKIRAKLTSDSTTFCPDCSQALSGTQPNGFTEASKHLEEHSYHCLHIGQESIRDSEGEWVQTTVAYFGSK